uniref:Uncharacterized protein n=1 Tax=Chromera velia CCMP2878 TaxID=1169474 RepID=A0A0G4I6D3_9ALVE|eukprot:Cvel_1889.t1-p1 / transcript=Cvel_1889.t1 / gene=Cvel_1889 / organism=Chromera_velia_CCMP2878 / gene_product=hypothetical protein / transcript_product=hypothetical protein / location=Cvel_scaffold70:118278-124811(-) / protein_length=1496 / sequence_SO=supercontig / SO=protein_coding / is_pseudo=false
MRLIFLFLFAGSNASRDPTFLQQHRVGKIHSGSPYSARTALKAGGRGAGETPTGPLEVLREFAEQSVAPEGIVRKGMGSAEVVGLLASACRNLQKEAEGGREGGYLQGLRTGDLIGVLASLSVLGFDHFPQPLVADCLDILVERVGRRGEDIDVLSLKDVHPQDACRLVWVLGSLREPLLDSAVFCEAVERLLLAVGRRVLAEGGGEEKSRNGEIGEEENVKSIPSLSPRLMDSGHFSLQSLNINGLCLLLWCFVAHGIFQSAGGAREDQKRMVGKILKELDARMDSGGPDEDFVSLGVEGSFLSRSGWSGESVGKEYRRGEKDDEVENKRAVFVSDCEIETVCRTLVGVSRFEAFSEDPEAMSNTCLEQVLQKGVRRLQKSREKEKGGDLERRMKEGGAEGSVFSSLLASPHGSKSAELSVAASLSGLLLVSPSSLEGGGDGQQRSGDGDVYGTERESALGKEFEATVVDTALQNWRFGSLEDLTEVLLCVSSIEQTERGQLKRGTEKGALSIGKEAEIELLSSRVSTRLEKALDNMVSSLREGEGGKERDACLFSVPSSEGMSLPVLLQCLSRFCLSVLPSEGLSHLRGEKDSNKQESPKESVKRLLEKVRDVLPDLLGAGRERERGRTGSVGLGVRDLCVILWACSTVVGLRYDSVVSLSLWARDTLAIQRCGSGELVKLIGAVSLFLEDESVGVRMDLERVSALETAERLLSSLQKEMKRRLSDYPGDLLVELQDAAVDIYSDPDSICVLSSPRPTGLVRLLSGLSPAVKKEGLDVEEGHQEEGVEARGKERKGEEGKEDKAEFSSMSLETLVSSYVGRTDPQKRTRDIRALSLTMSSVILEDVQRSAWRQNLREKEVEEMQNQKGDEWKESRGGDGEDLARSLSLPDILPALWGLVRLSLHKGDGRAPLLDPSFLLLKSWGGDQQGECQFSLPFPSPLQFPDRDPKWPFETPRLSGWSPETITEAVRALGDTGGNGRVGDRLEGSVLEAVVGVALRTEERLSPSFLSTLMHSFGSLGVEFVDLERGPGDFCAQIGVLGDAERGEKAEEGRESMETLLRGRGRDDKRQKRKRKVRFDSFLFEPLRLYKWHQLADLAVGCALLLNPDFRDASAGLYLRLGGIEEEEEENEDDAEGERLSARGKQEAQGRAILSPAEKRGISLALCAVLREVQARMQNGTRQRGDEAKEGSLIRLLWAFVTSLDSRTLEVAREDPRLDSENDVMGGRGRGNSLWESCFGDPMSVSEGEVGELCGGLLKDVLSRVTREEANRELLGLGGSASAVRGSKDLSVDTLLLLLFALPLLSKQQDDEEMPLRVLRLVASAFERRFREMKDGRMPSLSTLSGPRHVSSPDSDSVSDQTRRREDVQTVRTLPVAVEYKRFVDRLLRLRAGAEGANGAFSFLLAPVIRSAREAGAFRDSLVRALERPESDDTQSEGAASIADPGGEEGSIAEGGEPRLESGALTDSGEREGMPGNFKEKDGTSQSPFPLQSVE